MSDISASTINELFVQKLNSPDDLHKLAAEGSSFIRAKLREVAFSRKIVNPQYVTKADLTRSVNHDGLVKIVDIEPDSKAFAINFRGDAEYNYIEGERYEIPFYVVSSEDFQKVEEELLAYEMPLTEVIEKNSVLDIQKIEDTNFLTAVDAAITVQTSSVSGVYTSGTIPKTAFKDLFDVLDGNELESKLLLMDRKMWNRLFLYDATVVSDAVGAETVVNGYTYMTLFGRRLVVSNKTDLLDNKIYCFTDQEFFGQFLILNDTKFWIDKKKNMITFAAYESIGFGIGNTKACARLDLS